MSTQFEHLLGRARRRLIACRMVEASALAACAALLAGLCLQAAWMLARHTQAGALAVAAAPLLAAGLFVAAPGRRLTLLRPQRQAAMAALLLTAVGGAVAILLKLPQTLDRIGPAVVSPIAAAAIGAAWAWLRRPTRLASARWLDARAGLDGALATRAEGVDRGDGGASGMVESDVLARAQRLQRVRLWQRGRGLVGLLAIAALANVLVAALPRPGASDSPEARLAAGLERLSMQQRQQLAEALRQQARQQVDLEQARQLAQAAQAVLRQDPEALRQLLEELRRQGAPIVARLPADLVEAAGGGASSEPTQGHATGAGADVRPEAEAGPVVVYDPFYGEGPRRGTAKAEPLRDPVVPMGDAWDLARRRAADALAAGSVLPRHRPIVRAFFEAADP